MNWQNIKDKLKGLKTYCVSTLAGVAVLGAFITGSIDRKEAMKDAFALLLTCTMRAAVAKVEAAPDPEPEAEPKKPDHHGKKPKKSGR